MLIRGYLLIALASGALASTARAETTEPASAESTVYALVGNQINSGKLFQLTAGPNVALGLRWRAIPKSGNWGATWDMFASASQGYSALNQTSYQPDTELSIASVGWATGVCYLNSVVDVCPLLTLQTFQVNELKNHFAYWSLGYGLELDKSFGSYRYMLRATEANLGHKIAGILESGKFRTVSFGVGYLLGDK